MELDKKVQRIFDEKEGTVESVSVKEQAECDVDAIKEIETAEKKKETPIIITDLKGNRIKEGKNHDETSSEEEELEIDYSNVAYEEPAHWFSMYNGFRRLMEFCHHQFFKQIAVVGRHNIPKRGPVIFCGNHANQFCDGAILFFTAGRDTRAIVASKSLRRAGVGTMMKWAKCIGVERAMDLAKKGTGTVVFEDNTTVRGVGTKFTSEFDKGDQLFAITKIGEVSIDEQLVLEVISDTELRLKEPGVAAFEPEREYQFKILPKINQGKVFKDVETVLGGGGSLMIFPEGGSHDQPDLLPFKAGIALMTFSTIVNTGQVPVIIPSGLKYFNRDNFRSNVIVEYGRPFKPTKKMIDNWKKGDKRKAVSQFLSGLRERMKQVTMTAPSYNEMQSIYMARNLYLPKNIRNLSPEAENEIYQRFFNGYNMVKDNPEVKQLIEAITSYRMMLKLFNIADAELRYFNISWGMQLLLMMISLVRFIFSLIFVLPGNWMIYPLSLFIGNYVERERIKALKNSVVKVKAQDVSASLKIFTYICLYPFYLAFFCCLFAYALQWYGIPGVKRLTTCFAILFPATSLIAIRSHDGVQTHMTEFHGRCVNLFYSDQVELIKVTRRELKKRVRGLVDRLGPRLFKNFDKMRVIMFDKDSKDPNKAKSALSDAGSDRGKDDRSLQTSPKRPMSSKGFKTSGLRRNTTEPTFEQDKPRSEKSASQYDLDYKEELELNLAFEIFKDILD